MAYTIPEALSSRAGPPTKGERQVFQALRDHLPEDYLVYYDIPVEGRHPDFIVVGPDLGLVVLEVKDWRLESIVDVTRDGVRLRQAEGDLLLKNPVQQVREYTLRAVDLLRNRPLLGDGQRLCCAWGYGVIFPRLTSDDVRTPSLFGPSLEDALGPGLLLTGDDLEERALLPRLRALLPWRTSPLTPQQIDEIRGVLHPEIRMGWGRADDEILSVMDREQERVARTLGAGHHLVRGVAGSGKTVILICRARHLQERHPDWRILVLCFNRVLASFLRRAIAPDPRLEVRTFHAWCRNQLTAGGIAVPEPPGRGKPWHEHWERLPRLLLPAYDDGRIATGTYQAILVDEGQDFADDWYRVLLRALDPATDSLLVTLDSSQDIYRRDVSWRSLGVRIAGRTRVLRVNYRNTIPVLNAAYRMIQELDAAGSAMRETAEDYVVPDRALRPGPAPELRRHPSFEASRQHMLGWVRERLGRGVPPAQILVLGLSRPDMAATANWLSAEGIPAVLLGDGDPADGVWLSTIHSAKGLDADHVLLLAAHELEQRENAEARRLLYIAMTRATRDLCVSFHRDSALVAELARACAPRAAAADA